ncbi:MAG: Stp1/IreP family PP2C-type Ser/Thr phosphatase [Pseudomonadota bacterium]
MKAQLEIVCKTDTGQVRDHNEDFIDGDQDLGLVVLADGMGGYQAGEVASEMAVTVIMGELRKQLAENEKPLYETDRRTGFRRASMLLNRAVNKANRMIYKSAQDDADRHGMGTTVVAALFYQKYLSIAHVGDSRMYRFRNPEFSQITKDHSVLQELIDHGFYTPEQARHSPNKNLVTRALGVNVDVNVELTEEQTTSDDLYLLCSDGLSDLLEDKQIQAVIEKHNGHAEPAATELVQSANDHGGDDNISVILVRPLATLIQKGWLRRLFGG